MTQLFELFNKISPLSDALIERLGNTLKRREVRKKDYLLRAGQVCLNMNFIESGLFRCYHESNGNEIVTWFLLEGSFAISVKSFYKQLPSLHSIQALEDSSVYYLSYNEVNQLYKEFPEFNFHGRVLTQEYYLECDERHAGTFRKTAEERLKFLHDEHPEFFDKIPARELAKYLGMREETYSRIKNNLAT